MSKKVDLIKIKENLLANWKSLKKAKILVVGDVGLDQYVTGNVKRISPEAPVPVLEARNEFYRLGLSTNVAQNIKSLGGEPVLLSVIGKDKAAESLKKILTESSISTTSLIEANDRPTTLKIRMMSEIHHLLRVDYERSDPIDKDLQVKILKEFESNIDSCDGVILQDYAKGVLSKELNSKMIHIAKEKSKPVLVDPNDKNQLDTYIGATLMTPNLKEAIHLAKWEDKEDLSLNQIDDLGYFLQEKIMSPAMIITRSKDGMNLYENGQSFNVPTFARQVYDVTGAGDTVISALSLAYLSGFSLLESCVFANLAAGLVVAKVGSAACTLDEVKEVLNQH